jgi:hypothetical protein
MKHKLKTLNTLAFTRLSLDINSTPQSLVYFKIDTNQTQAYKMSSQYFIPKEMSLIPTKSI